MEKTNNSTKQMLGKSNSFKVFHGSYKPIDKTSTKVNKYTKDFGTGFYVTALKQQADLWAEKGNMIHSKDSKGFEIWNEYDDMTHGCDMYYEDPTT